MKFGVTRHGPRAPDAFQFGKYEVFTRTGDPVRSTSNEMRSSLVRIRLTRAGATRTRGASTLTPLPIAARLNTLAVGACSRTGTRAQASGPPAARATSRP